ncbi:hypothetical protein OHB04_27645 [Streptomyces sp. NBC_01775]|uniref:FtsX-like permease family protein n=1 Tax=Streptomyces sp. NBC_01775 TaxID=2975939 RepID=UPI002DDC0742|nr:FtsX-like permease family protein [Streptomyces sp. NBC_01775]WSB79144.1 hypothetical protein OHB04_27645 [Streptomyces sp. NBC_01775]
MPTRHDSVPHPDPDPDPVPVPVLPHDPDPDPDPHRGSVPDPGPAPRSARGGWLLARLRAAPGGALAFAALVCVAVFTAAALPRALDASSDAALRSALDRARPADRMVSATASAGPEAGVRDELRRRIAPGAVRTAYAALSDAVRSPLPPADGEAAYGVHNTTPAEADDPGLPRPSSDVRPKATLTAQARLAGRTRLAEGRMPSPTVKGSEGRRRVQAAVTAETAHRMKLAPGDTFHLPGSLGGTTVEVTGVVAPRGSRAQVRESTFWHAEESMVRPSLVTIPPDSPAGQKRFYWHFSAFIHPKAAPALLEMRDGAELFFHHPVLASKLSGHQASGAARKLAEVSSGAPAARLQSRAGVGTLTFDTGLQETLEAYERESAAVSPLLLIACLGLATTGLTVLLLAGVLAAERRTEEFALLRSRGASLWGLSRRLLAETGVVAVPAAAVATAVALWATPGARTGAALAAAAAVTVTACLALPLRAALAHRTVRATRARADVTRARRSRRRTVLEAAVFALVAGAVVAVRQRGTGDGDTLLALAPVLVATAAAMLLLRCYPLPLRLLSRLAVRRSGPVAFLGLARAARAPSAAVSGPALLALLVALTVASFGGTVLASIAEGRDAAALRAVGADARIEDPAAEHVLPKLAKRVAKAPGVAGVTAVRSHDDGELVNVTDSLTVALVDASAYARLTHRDGQGPFSPDDLGLSASNASSGPVPALVSPGIARKLGGGSEYTDLILPGLQLPVRPAVVREHTPAARDGDFVVLSREAVARARPDTRNTALLAPNTLLVSGASPDAATLRQLLKEADPKADPKTLVSSRSEKREQYADSVLQAGAERLYTAAVLAAAGFSALAVLLSLLQTAPDRRALLVRLRTLGLPRRQGRGVLLVESLPLYVLTALAGALSGLATVPLLGPGIDLAALAGTPDSLPVRIGADPASLALPPLALLAPALLGLFAQARLAGRGSPDPRTENLEPR